MRSVSSRASSLALTAIARLRMTSLSVEPCSTFRHSRRNASRRARQGSARWSKSSLTDRRGIPLGSWSPASNLNGRPSHSQISKDAQEGTSRKRFGEGSGPDGRGLKKAGIVMIADWNRRLLRLQHGHCLFQLSRRAPERAHHRLTVAPRTFCRSAGSDTVVCCLLKPRSERCHALHNQDTASSEPDRSHGRSYIGTPRRPCRQPARHSGSITPQPRSRDTVPTESAYWSTCPAAFATRWPQGEIVDEPKPVEVASLQPTSFFGVV
jgi:hypothetical protein